MLKTIILPALLLSAPVFAGQSESSPYAPLSRFVSESKQIVGLPYATSIVLIKEGQIVYSRGFGYADIERRLPATEKTVFYIASATKPFYALSLLIDESKGKFSTEQTLNDMFPAAALAKPEKQRITASQLLTHTSGLENDILGTALAYSGIHTPKSTLAMLNQPYTRVSQNAQFDYTNFGYNILSIWQQNTRHTSWQQSIEDNIIKPLGLTRTTPYASLAEQHNWPLAEPYSMLADSPSEALNTRKTDQTMHSAGGLLASAEDLGTFVSSLMQAQNRAGGSVFPRQVVTKALATQVKTQSRFENLERTGYAYGWYTGNFKGEHMLHHLGSYAGTHAHVSFMPEKKLGVIVLNNEDTVSIKVTSQIVELAYALLLEEAEHPSEKDALKQLQSQFTSMDKALKAHKQKIASRPIQLSLEKSAYAGEYVHPLLGTATVTLNAEGTLTLKWGLVESQLSGYPKPDTLRYTYSPRAGAVASFKLNAGKITGLTIEGALFEKV